MPGPFFSIRSTLSSRLCMRIASPLRLSRMSTTSSCTPSIVVYSCSTPSMFTSTTAQPGIDDSRMRRSALPSVWPKPRSRGSRVMRVRRAPSGVTSETLGFNNSSTIVSSALLRVEFDDQRLVDVLGQVAAGRHGIEHAAHFLRIHFQPLREAELLRERERILNAGLLGSAFTHGDDVRGLHLIRRNI